MIALSLGERFPENAGTRSSIVVYVEDVDATYGRALDAGATAIAAPEDKPYRDRAAGVRDVFGNQLVDLDLYRWTRDRRARDRRRRQRSHHGALPRRGRPRRAHPHRGAAAPDDLPRGRARCGDRRSRARPTRSRAGRAASLGSIPRARPRPGKRRGDRLRDARVERRRRAPATDVPGRRRCAVRAARRLRRGLPGHAAADRHAAGTSSISPRASKRRGSRSSSGRSNRSPRERPWRRSS